MVQHLCKPIQLSLAGPGDGSEHTPPGNRRNARTAALLYHTHCYLHIATPHPPPYFPLLHLKYSTHSSYKESLPPESSTPHPPGTLHPNKFSGKRSLSTCLSTSSHTPHESYLPLKLQPRPPIYLCRAFLVTPRIAAIRPD